MIIIHYSFQNYDNNMNVITEFLKIKHSRKFYSGNIKFSKYVRGDNFKIWGKLSDKSYYNEQKKIIDLEDDSKPTKNQQWMKLISRKIIFRYSSIDKELA